MAVCVVSHDAGGAEILASYVAQQSLDALLVLEGPALQVFERRLGKQSVFSLEEALPICDWCLCGTSWQSDLEWQAIGQARQLRKRVVAFLDHWVNYPERFCRQGIQHLPDEIWVGDVDAERLAKQCFAEMPIRLVANPYFADLQRELKDLEQRRSPKSAAGARVLFVCENISEHALRQYGDERYWGYTEFDALDFLFSNLDKLGRPVESVIIRPHPSDLPGKYQTVLDAYIPLACLGGKRSLLEEIVDADIVVGCESMAMVVSLLANRPTWSCSPSNSVVPPLPQKDILRIG